MKIETSLFLAAAAFASSSSSATSVTADKQQRLVLFAGPHGAASSTIEAFYRKFASTAGGEKHGSFGGWEWPDLAELPLVKETGVAADSALSLLVTGDDEDDLQEQIMARIHKLWTRDDRPSVFLGSDELDRIGVNPYTGRNALHAAHRLANRLGVEPQSVEVVMNYRTPRIDQWISIWKHLTKESEERYRPFLCTTHHIHAKKVWEMLDTAMNPLKVAHSYREDKFRVTLVDMAKVVANERDVVHVIGCDVLGLPCGGQHPGWIDGLFDHTFFKGHEDREYPNFGEEMERDMETLFRNRDCHHASSLAGDSSVRVVNSDKAKMLLSKCDDSLNSEYKRLADTTTLYNELRHLRQCAEPDLTFEMINAKVDAGAENITIADPKDATTVDAKASLIEDLEEAEEVIKEEEEEIKAEEAEINEEIAEQEDGRGSGGNDGVDIDAEDAEDVAKEMEAVDAEIKSHPGGEAALAAKSGEEGDDYESPDAKSALSSALGVLVPVVVVGAIIAFFVRRRRSSGRQPLPVEFASVDEEFGDATMEDMQPRFTD